MTESVKPTTRGYHAPRRAAAAARTREVILAAAKARFEASGWAGSTIAAIAADADVSPKTIEALFATKAALLTAVVDYAIRGDAGETPMVGRDAGLAIESAPTAAALLQRHAAYAVAIVERSAPIAWVVESAAAGDRRVGELWERMRHNRRFGARWAAENLLRKPGVRRDVGVDDAERVFLVAIDWGTYRTLTGELGLAPEDVCDWLHEYYRRMLLARPGRP